MLHCSSFCYIKPRKAYLIPEKIRRVDKITDNDNFPRQKAGRRHLVESFFFVECLKKRQQDHEKSEIITVFITSGVITLCMWLV